MSSPQAHRQRQALTFWAGSARLLALRSERAEAPGQVQVLDSGVVLLGAFAVERNNSETVSLKIKTIRSPVDEGKGVGLTKIGVGLTKLS
jgi:hypothetical protein